MKIKCGCCGAETESETGETTIPEGSNAAKIKDLESKNERLAGDCQRMKETIERMKEERKLAHVEPVQHKRGILGFLDE